MWWPWALFQLISSQHQCSHYTNNISQDGLKFKNVITTCPFIYSPGCSLQVKKKKKRQKSLSIPLRWVSPSCLCDVLGRDLTWHDLDLIVERAPVTLYQRGPLDVFLPLVYGILLGFGGTLLMGIFALFIIIHISQRRRWSYRNPTNQQ